MNMQSIMAQAQKMQRDITKKKGELDNTEFTGKSEWVSVKFNGAKKLIDIKIIKEGNLDEDDKEALEDMLKIAINDAMSQIDKATEKIMGNISQFGGLF